MRLYPEDIASLFPEVPVGTQVRIINEPYLAGWRDGQLFLEAHEPLVEDAKRWKGSLREMENAVADKLADLATEVNWDKARGVAREARGIPVPIALHSLDLAEVSAEAPAVFVGGHRASD